MIADALATYIIASTLANSPTSLPVDMNDYICMAEAIHFEARGETDEGMIAVGEVIMNRVESKRFPDTICEVVHQDKQFSYRNSGAPSVTITNDIEAKAFARIASIALDVVSYKATKLDIDADHYYAHDKVQPYWISYVDAKVIVGNHTFVKLK